MLLEFGIIGAAIAQDARQNYQIKQKGKKLEAQGAYLPRNNDLHWKLFKEYWDDLRNERGELVPEEYIAYFKLNEHAANEFINASCSLKEIRAGYQPYMCIGTYNRATFSPMANFLKNYGDKIDIYNKTGEFIF